MDEISYLKSKNDDIKFNSNRFTLFVNDGEKYIFGILSSSDNQLKFGKLYEYRTLYQTLTDIDVKIKISLNKALEYAYDKELEKTLVLSGKVLMKKQCHTIILKMLCLGFPRYGI